MPASHARAAVAYGVGFDVGSALVPSRHSPTKFEAKLLIVLSMTLYAHTATLARAPVPVLLVAGDGW